MKLILGKRLTAMFIAVFALVLVGVGASRTASACTPEGYAEELRYEGELPGGG